MIMRVYKLIKIVLAEVAGEVGEISDHMEQPWCPQAFKMQRSGIPLEGAKTKGKFDTFIS